MQVRQYSQYLSSLRFEDAQSFFPPTPLTILAAPLCPLNGSGGSCSRGTAFVALSAHTSPSDAISTHLSPSPGRYSAPPGLRPPFHLFKTFGNLGAPFYFTFTSRVLTLPVVLSL